MSPLEDAPVEDPSLSLRIDKLLALRFSIEAAWDSGRPLSVSDPTSLSLVPVIPVSVSVNDPSVSEPTFTDDCNDGGPVLSSPPKPNDAFSDEDSDVAFVRRPSGRSLRDKSMPNRQHYLGRGYFWIHFLNFYLTLCRQLVRVFLEKCIDLNENRCMNN